MEEMLRFYCNHPNGPCIFIRSCMIFRYRKVSRGALDRLERSGFRRLTVRGYVFWKFPNVGEL